LGVFVKNNYTKMYGLNVKTTEELKAAVQKLETDPEYAAEWAAIPSDVKTTLLNDVYDDLASDLLRKVVRGAQPKKERASRKPRKKKTEDTEGTQTD
jgi:hypothetical protein